MDGSGNSSVYDWKEENYRDEIDNNKPVYEWEEQNKYELLAWVKASERRVDILTSLAESPRNTNDFADKWETSTEAVSYHLKQLHSGGSDGRGPALVEIITPQRNRYRLWGLTKHGRCLIEYL